MGEVAEQVGAFVTAYSSDLKDESLDGQRVVIGGIVTGFRTVITKANATMGVATLEDLQGTIEVVVFPRMYEQTAATWTEGTILLVAGRIDHRGEDVSLLADLAVDWDDAIARGPGGVRPRGRGRRPRTAAATAAAGRERLGNGTAAAERQRLVAPVAGAGAGRRRREPVGVMAPSAAAGARAVAVGRRGRRARPRDARPGRDPARRPAGLAAARRGAEPHGAVGDLPAIAPAEPIPTYAEPDGLAAAIAAAPPRRTTSRPSPTRRGHGPPARRRRRRPRSRASPTRCSTSGSAARRRTGWSSRWRRSSTSSASDRAGRASSSTSRRRTAAATLPMELSRRVAYDAELLSEVRRRLGDGPRRPDASAERRRAARSRRRLRP